jgi:hypothetical protein
MAGTLEGSRVSVKRAISGDNFPITAAWLCTSLERFYLHITRSRAQIKSITAIIITLCAVNYPTTQQLATF